MKWINQYTGFVRQLRFVYWLNNWRHRKQLAKNKAIYQKFGIQQSVLKCIDSRILKKYVGDIRNFQPETKTSTPDISQLSPKIQSAISNFDEQGFVKLDGFLSAEQVASINQAIENGLANQQLHFNYTQRKIFNAHLSQPTIANFAQDEQLLAILKALIGQNARHFQTINFKKGSEQMAHSDSIHMTTLPLGNLLGVWVALENIHEANGPLTYYAGSHKLRYILNDDYNNSSNFFLLDGNANEKYERHVQAEIEANQLVEEHLYAQAGDVFIWHANLMHGGAPIKDESLTRKSMVLHYFGENALCFHEISERPALF